MLLRDLLTTTKDGDWGKDDPAEGFTPFRVIRGADFPKVQIGDTSTVPVRYLDIRTVERRTLQPGDIIIETAGGNRDRPTGRTLLVTKRLLESFALPVTCASFCRFLRIDASVADPRYVFWYLQYLYQRGAMSEHQVQHTGVARFQYTQFAASTTIPLPPLSEQRDIAHALGAIDDKIELNCRMNETLEALARGIFKSWFVDFEPVWAKMNGRQPAGIAAETAALFPAEFEDSVLGLIPKGWRAGKVSDICTTQYGYTASASQSDTGPYFLRITDMNKQPWIEWHDVPYCQISDELLPRYKLEIGDVLVSRMADPGKAAIIEEDVSAVFASYLIRLKTVSLASSYYLFYFLRSEEYLEYAQGAMSGSVQANMNAKVITAADMLTPSTDAMLAFKNIILPLRQRIVSSLRESNTLAVLRDTLLPKLLSSEVKVLVRSKEVIAND